MEEIAEGVDVAAPIRGPIEALDPEVAPPLGRLEQAGFWHLQAGGPRHERIREFRSACLLGVLLGGKLDEPVREPRREFILPGHQRLPILAAPDQHLGPGPARRPACAEQLGQDFVTGAGQELPRLPGHHLQKQGLTRLRGGRGGGMVGQGAHGAASEPGESFQGTH